MNAVTQKVFVPRLRLFYFFVEFFKQVGRKAYCRSDNSGGASVRVFNGGFDHCLCHRDNIGQIVFVFADKQLIADGFIGGCLGAFQGKGGFYFFAYFRAFNPFGIGVFWRRSGLFNGRVILCYLVIPFLPSAKDFIARSP
jgi:hypothetical protein